MKTMKQLNLYPFYDLAGMAEHLRNMAGKGWFLEKTGTLFWTYRKAEPKALRYSLCWSGEAEAYEPEAGQPGTFRDHALKAGWKAAAISDRLQVYSTEEETPDAFSVSPYDRIMGVQQAAKPYLFFYGTMILLGLLSLMLLVFKLRIMPVAALAGGFSLMIPVVLNLLAVYFLFSIIQYFIWKNRAEISATQKKYERLRLPMARILFYVLLVSAVLLGLSGVTSGASPMIGVFFAFLVGILGLMMVVKAVKGSLQGRSRILTAILDVLLAVILVSGVTMAVTRINEADAGYRGSLPVTAQDLGLASEEDSLQDYARTKSSGLLRYTEASQVLQQEDGTYAPILSYEMVEGRAVGVHGMVFNHYLNRMASSARKDENGEIVSVSYKPIPEGPWQAEKAFQMTDGTIDFNVYLVLYENSLLEIGAEEALTEEQMGIFGKKISQ